MVIVFRSRINMFGAGVGALESRRFPAYILSQAIDIRVPGISTELLRDAALSFSGGGVGYYPRSGFVHVDADPIRRAQLKPRDSVRFTERWAGYINLGVIEWRKVYTEHEKLGKKTILSVITDDTKNCDDVAAYLEGNYSDLKDLVLIIHTKPNGEISEAASGKNKEELTKLRKEANEIDSWESPHKAVVSVMILKEGWDVRNVTTIVGLRAYAPPSDILPEQALGRGQRKMYEGGIEEYVSVVGTNAFMEFVERIMAEGVVLDRKPMDVGSKRAAPLIVELDDDKDEEQLAALVVKSQ